MRRAGLTIDPEVGLYRHYKGGVYRLLLCATVVNEEIDAQRHRTAPNTKYLFPAKLSEMRSIPAIVCLHLETGELLLRCERVRGYEARTRVCVYCSLEKGLIWARPLVMWRESLEWEGVTRLRFVGPYETTPP